MQSRQSIFISERAVVAALAGEPFRAPWEKPLSLERALTEIYRRNESAHPAVREVECLRIQLPAMMQPMRQGDVFAGRVRYPLAGFSPELPDLGFYCMEEPIRKMLARPDAYSFSKHDCDEITGMLDFWTHRVTRDRVRAAYPESVRRTLPSDDWTGRPGAAFPLYRMAGITLDHKKLLRLGIPGLASHVREHIAGAAAGDDDVRALFNGMLKVLEILADLCRRHAGEARMLGMDESAAALDAIACREPRTLREAIQLFWLITLASGVFNHGRMDVFLGPFLARDLASGALDEAGALDLLRALWRMIADYDNMWNNRIVVGGRGRPDESAADRFALLAIEATRTVHTNQPQLTLRFYDGQNPALMRAALTSIGEGRTFPMLYNDDVIIPAVSASFGISPAEAVSWFPFGCGEYVIDHASTGTPNGLINLLRVLEEILRDDACSQKLDTFEKLWREWARRVDCAMEALAMQEKITYEITGRDAPFLLISLLFDDCLARRKGVFSGGARYLGGTVESYGNTNTADSFLAIRKLVYEERVCTLAELARACAANFAGPDAAALRRRMLAAPKFGNDDDEADGMAARVHEHVCASARAQASRAGLDTYHVVVINNSANTTFGRHTGASPDGRCAGAPLANAINPSPGCDRNGVTAFLNSLLRIAPDIHAGTVQNMKFSRGSFGPRLRPKTEALLAGYFSNGGTQAMITVVDRRDLEEAMREPEKWGHLMVRVGGFSARFVELERDVQMEILARTLNE